MDVIITSLFSITGNWPCHVLAPGARAPLLFADRGEIGSESSVDVVAAASEIPEEPGAIDEEHNSRFSKLIEGHEEKKRLKWIPSNARFLSWIHERTRLEWKDKTDAKGANFVNVESLYQSIGALDDGVHEYTAVELRPHQPRLQGHYYAWTAPAGISQPNGDRLRTLIDFFDQVKDECSKAVTLAALLTPGWGGPYGKRPAFVVTAPDRGYGKSTVAEVIARIWGGYISVNAEQKHNEDELYQRLLSAEALTKRVALIDNVKGTLSSGTLEQLITSETISGKRMYSGEASRPNTMTYFVTANGVRLSRDMASRSYFIQLEKPEYRSHWDEDLAEFVLENGKGIIADCMWILQQPVRTLPGKVDRWGLWGKSVLARACDFLGIAVDKVMAQTYELREEADDDLEEARMLVRYVIEKECSDLGYVKDYDSNLKRPHAYRTFKGAPLFIASSLMAKHFQTAMNKPKMPSKQVFHIIQGHLEAGRMKEFSFKRTRTANGYEVAGDAIDAYLDALEAGFIEAAESKSEGETDASSA